jgi:hypothetical protein
MVKQSSKPFFSGERLDLREIANAFVEVRISTEMSASVYRCSVF